ncbi:unnamed protein product [Rhizophagus irregularis]|nr:unnamed protein product [Rhizophagus irregularis]
MNYWYELADAVQILRNRLKTKNEYEKDVDTVIKDISYMMSNNNQTPMEIIKLAYLDSIMVLPCSYTFSLDSINRPFILARIREKKYNILYNSHSIQYNICILIITKENKKSEFFTGLWKIVNLQAYLQYWQELMLTYSLTSSSINLIINIVGRLYQAIIYVRKRRLQPLSIIERDDELIKDTK